MDAVCLDNSILRATTIRDNQEPKGESSGSCVAAKSVGKAPGALFFAERAPWEPFPMRESLPESFNPQTPRHLSQNPNHNQNPDDQLRFFFAFFGDKWTAPVIRALGQEVRRYSDLKRLLPGISNPMLTRTLRRLENAGLLQNALHPEVPVRSEYELTPLGRRWLKRLESLLRSIQPHADELERMAATLRTSE